MMFFLEFNAEESENSNGVDETNDYTFQEFKQIKEAEETLDQVLEKIERYETRIEEQSGGWCFETAIPLIKLVQLKDLVLKRVTQTGIDLVPNEENYLSAFPNGEETKETFQRILCVIGSEKEIERLKEKEQQLRRDIETDKQEKEDEEERAEDEEKEKEEKEQNLLHRAFKDSCITDELLDEMYLKHIGKLNGQLTKFEKFTVLYENLGSNVNVSVF